MRPSEEIGIHCEAPDRELLLVDWLNALIFEMSSKKMVFGRFRVETEDNRLEGSAWGEPMDVLRHRLGVEVKGATYTALEVRESPEGEWVAQCVVDV